MPEGRSLPDQGGSPAVAYIAKCAEHGLHGERDDCFVCGEPVAMIGYVRADLHLQVHSARGRHEAEARRLRAENERLRETMREAAGHLCMTQCPAYTDNGVCTGGCYTEPSCQTDEPTEGWIVAALNLLVPDEDESPLPADEHGVAAVDSWCEHCDRKRTVPERDHCGGCGRNRFVFRRPEVSDGV